MFETRNLPLRKLDRSRVHEFAYHPSEEENSELVMRNEWRSLADLSLEGILEPIEEGWELSGHILGSLKLSCVISGAPIGQKLNLQIRRLYTHHGIDFPQDFNWDMDFDVEKESVPQNLDLLELLSESLLLATPEYPRLTKYETETLWEHDPISTRDELQSEQKPFAALKSMLDEKNSK